MSEVHPLNLKTAKDMVQFILTREIDYIDACFCDPLGIWHHCTFAPSQVKEKDIKNGFAFDGSSIRIFTTVEASDMLMIPDVTSCWIDAFHKPWKVLHVNCDVAYPSGAEFSRCPRGVAKRAVNFMQKEGLADTIYFGPEAEFFVFDSIKFSCKPNKVSFELDMPEAFWNTDAETPDKTPTGNTNLGARLPMKKAYFPTLPLDPQTVLRNEMLDYMKQIGIPIEKHHHEVATCQHELGFSFSNLLTCADQLMAYKYIVRNVARKHGLTATFMPKPIFSDNGSGMHCHQSIWKNGVNLFFDDKGKYMKLSQTAIWYIGGLLKHSGAVLAFTNSTVNSYKRLVPGYEAPVHLVYSGGNRSAAIRIPLQDSDSHKAKRIEFRCPDPAGCPYLMFAAMLMAGLDGLRNKIEPPEPLEVDFYELNEEAQKSIKKTPTSLDEALDALRDDHEFLCHGGVFTEDFIMSYISTKKQDIKACNMIPHPKEFELYFNC